MKVLKPKGYRLLRKNEIVRKTDRRIVAGKEPVGSLRVKDTISVTSLIPAFVGQRPGNNSLTGYPRLFIRKIK